MQMFTNVKCHNWTTQKEFVQVASFAHKYQGNRNKLWKRTEFPGECMAYKPILLMDFGNNQRRYRNNAVRR